MKDYLTVGELVDATGGRLLRGKVGERVRTFSTDSRRVSPGDLFVALKGPHFDGHQFVGEALRKGALGAIVSSPTCLCADGGRVFLQVDDTLYALGEIARCWRQMHPARVVAITGSTGKTTTKEWAAAVLRRRYQVLASSGSYNNLIGLPLSLLHLRPWHQVAVLELGMSARGEIRRLSQICQPDLGLITNIGPAHLEYLRSLDEVAAAKAEMVEFLAGDGILILNGDDPRLRDMAGKAGVRCFTFGMSSDCDLRACGVQMGHEGLRFQLLWQGERVSVRVLAWGRHHVHNALGAAAVGILRGMTLLEVGEGLSSVRPPAMRLERLVLANGVVVFNDAYNANPVSMRAAIEAFLELKGSSRGILVLGDMLELGIGEEAMHREIGAYLASSQEVGALITVGERCLALAQEARSKGLLAPIVNCEHPEEAASVLRSMLQAGDWVLVKGSRAMKMEKVLEGLE